MKSAQKIESRGKIVQAEAVALLVYGIAPLIQLMGQQQQQQQYIAELICSKKGEGIVLPRWEQQQKRRKGRERSHIALAGSPVGKKEEEWYWQGKSTTEQGVS